MSDYIPSDIIPLILKNLPIKSLVRFTVVCKSWRTMIKDSKFITAHFNNHNGSQLLLVHRVCSESWRRLDLRYFIRGIREEVYSLHHDNPAFADYCEVGFRSPIPARKMSSECFRVVGVCNGLVCLTDDLDGFGSNFILWNPAIRKMLTLPEPRVVFNIEDGFVSTLGFGFDAIANDYKVVRVVTDEQGFEKRPKNDNDKQTFVEVFSLAKGEWSYPRCVGFKCAIQPCSPQAFVNGALHWDAQGLASSLHSYCVLAFDVSSEVFRKIRMPNSLDKDSVTGRRAELTLRLSVSADGKSLALFTRYRSHTGLKSDIWVMKEYCVESSWTKLRTLHPQGPEKNLPIALYIRSNGEVVVALSFEQHHSREEPRSDLISLDLARGVYQDLEISQYQYYTVNAYEESIVLLDRNDAVSSLSCRKKKRMSH